VSTLFFAKKAICSDVIHNPFLGFKSAKKAARSSSSIFPTSALLALHSDANE
jgi:hypothetical protein